MDHCDIEVTTQSSTQQIALFKKLLRESDRPAMQIQNTERTGHSADTRLFVPQNT